MRAPGPVYAESLLVEEVEVDAPSPGAIGMAPFCFKLLLSVMVVRMKAGERNGVEWEAGRRRTLAEAMKPRRGRNSMRRARFRLGSIVQLYISRLPSRHACAHRVRI